MQKPEVLEVVQNDVMGTTSRTITARVRYGGQVLTATFTGSKKGRPGDVAVDIEGIRITVPSPKRFGPVFNKAWVETYLEKET